MLLAVKDPVSVFQNQYATTLMLVTDVVVKIVYCWQAVWYRHRHFRVCLQFYKPVNINITSKLAYKNTLQCSFICESDCIETCSRHSTIWNRNLETEWLLDWIWHNFCWTRIERLPNISRIIYFEPGLFLYIS